mgnify:CR=1 FL=1
MSCETTQNLLPHLLNTTLMLFRESAREVIKSVVGFVRICVAAMDKETLQPLLPQLLEGLMKWNTGKDRFRAKIKIILKKVRLALIDKHSFGFNHKSTNNTPLNNGTVSPHLRV